ncbi:hypothetical protein [Streptomyces sp. NBC_01506]|uniref:hypothetical protein n=1 Tax=Streptomyces sp. NBC_01506 TaxID=2903887 RepID=UPI0038684104
MTTTARRPSPADMARSRPRPRPSLADVDAGRHLITPHVRSDGEPPFRFLYERLIRTSGMHRHHRLVALTLSTHGDWTTGVIAADDQPYLAGLTTETALLDAQVVIALTALLHRGWLRRESQGPRERYETARLQLTVPKPVMTRLLRE